MRTTQYERAETKLLHSKGHPYETISFTVVAAEIRAKLEIVGGCFKTNKSY